LKRGGGPCNTRYVSKQKNNKWTQKKLQVLSYRQGKIKEFGAI
jgi:hypothetical protein